MKISLCRDKKRSGSTPWIILFLLSSAVLVWSKRRWIMYWMRWRQGYNRFGDDIGRISGKPLVIPTALTLRTTRDSVMITIAETAQTHLDLFYDLTQMRRSKLVMLRPSAPQTAREVHARVKALSIQQVQQKGLMFFVMRDNKLIGIIGFVRLHPLTYSGELDVTSNSGFWDDGWAEDMHLSVLDYGFGQLGLQRILCGIERSHRQARTFYDRYGWNLVSVGRAGSPNMYNYVLAKRDYDNIIRPRFVKTLIPKGGHDSALARAFNSQNNGVR
uniref:N-acetyltransferase domain-containing protein n=1 Tax=Spongospora subterranea TaxID=70186 RepID=A0A0H5R9U2_9EUKA|eukprot:CRZ10858.1 hypothetical protein [Spongospora subterranea]